MVNNEFQMDLFSIIDSANRLKGIKYDFHHQLIELGFHCNRVGKSYYRRIFYDDEILTYPTYLLSFDDLLNQFVMRYKNIASDKDMNFRDELYRIKDEDCLRK